MNSATVALFGLTLVIAVIDWVAVGRDLRRLEYVAKPATMVPLVAAALTIDAVSEAARWWFVVALVWSLAGDVFLMLRRDDLFVFGLGSFLVGHVAYVVGFTVAGLDRTAVVVGAVAAVLAVAALAPRVVRGAHDTDPRLAVPVSVYVLVISTMVVTAVGSTVAVAIAGALLFWISDLTIGWSTFVRDVGGSRLVIIVTYHLAQVLLVASLAVAR